MLHLMNSAMMPQEGRYECTQITAKKAKEIFSYCIEENGFLESYIGYAQTARVLSKLFGIEIFVSRKAVALSNGDSILAVRLPYRVYPDEKARKLHGQKLDDYEFFFITFDSMTGN